MEVRVMKKYNTPEMKVSMFEKESVLTISNGMATLDAFAKEKGITAFVKDWETVANELSITF